MPPSFRPEGDLQQKRLLHNKAFRHKVDLLEPRATRRRILTPYSLLEKHFGGNSAALEIVYRHSRMVADKALAIAQGAGLGAADLRLIEEAALLHDIGVCRVHAPKLHCLGDAPYICHGIIGREILEGAGLPLHAMICERHIGVGLTTGDITVQKLPLPLREMSPQTLPERIVALADLFYSKKAGELDREKSALQVKNDLMRYGAQKVAIFENWLSDFRLSPAVPAP
jgi:uncharacterized protein